MAWTTDFPKPICTVENCNEPVRSKGLCRIHYQRMYVQGRTERVKHSREGVCLVEDCGLPIKGVGYCNKHYQLFKRNGSPQKLVKTAREHPLYVVWFEKLQNKRLCEEWQSFKVFCDGVGERPEGNFVLNRPNKTKPYGSDNFEWYEQLKKEEDEGNKEWWARKWKDARVRNPDVEYHRNLQRSFGIGLDEYLDKFNNQNGVCAICSNPETTVGQGKTLRRLAVDHNHKTGKIRELLCFRCNATLGKIDEDLELLEKIKKYLLKHKEN